MANVFNSYKKRIADGVADLDASTSQKYRVVLLEAMPDPWDTADYDFTTVAAVLADAGWTEYSGSPSRQDAANQATENNTTADATYFKVDRVTFSSVTGGNDIVGVLVVEVASPGTPNDSNDHPVASSKFASAITPNGGDLNVDFAGGNAATQGRVLEFLNA